MLILKMTENKSTTEMLADLLREAGMLMFLFVDLIFIEHPPSWLIVAIGVFLGLFFSIWV